MTRPPTSPSKLTRLLIRALESAWDASTKKVYKTHLKSYLSFIRSHKFAVEPNETTLALYVVYMCQFIKASSVESYLTGITHYLSPFYPELPKWRSSTIVCQALRGCKKLNTTGVHRKRALTIDDLNLISNTLIPSDTYDDKLFLAILLSGFFGLLRLGELVYPTDRSLDDPRKSIKRETMHLEASHLRFLLPYHKADRFFQQNTILILPNNAPCDPIRAMARYVTRRDRFFPTTADLWVRADGSKPRRNWFLSHLKAFHLGDVAGHSLRSGGATMLAKNGVDLQIIQALGRWSSDAFRSYIRLHPMLLHTAVVRNL